MDAIITYRLKGKEYVTCEALGVEVVSGFRKIMTAQECFNHDTLIEETDATWMNPDDAIVTVLPDYLPENL
jgi:hypothetical protein